MRFDLTLGVSGVLYRPVIILAPGFTLYRYNLFLTKHTVKIHKNVTTKLLLILEIMPWIRI